ncbi:MAG: asparagine--tRNA ligase, partial [Treponema sp.]|nr:asparagine--tRNA ligase [Treponema sp.]
MKPILIKDLLTSNPDGRNVTVCGWVRTKRDSKNLVFIQVNDGSCFASIQLTYDRTNPGEADTAAVEEALKLASTGASLRAEGKLIPSPGSGQAVEVTLVSLKILGACP